MAKKDDVTVLAATGDDGSTDFSSVSGTTLFTSRAVDWPGTDPLVTAVGGLQLHLSRNGSRLLPDNVWNDTYNTSSRRLLNGDARPNPLATGGGQVRDLRPAVSSQTELRVTSVGVAPQPGHRTSR